MEMLGDLWQPKGEDAVGLVTYDIWLSLCHKGVLLSCLPSTALVMHAGEALDSINPKFSLEEQRDPIRPSH